MSKKKKTRKKRRREAIYKCVGCNRVYSGKPGSQGPCGKCESSYFEWLNYGEFEIERAKGAEGYFEASEESRGEAFAMIDEKIPGRKGIN